MRPKTLVVILCQAREIELTLPSLRKNVLTPLNADLAYVGGPLSDSERLTLEPQCRFSHELSEPDSWGEFLDAKDPTGGWKKVADVHPGLLGGTGYGNSVGSGAIIMWFREELREFFQERSSDLAGYDWLLVTRSDFAWPVEHPPVDFLDPEKIYLMDGERYGGVSDRYLLVHRAKLEPILHIASPIFHSGETLAIALENRKVSNPETFILSRLEDLKMIESLVFLPYLGLSIRRAETSTRWSQGQFSRYWNLYIKYPKEAYSVVSALLTISNRPNWAALLAGRQAMRTAALKLLLALFEALGRFWPTRRPLHWLIFPILPLKSTRSHTRSRELR